MSPKHEIELAVLQNRVAQFVAAWDALEAARQTGPYDEHAMCDCLCAWCCEGDEQEAVRRAREALS